MKLQQICSGILVVSFAVSCNNTPTPAATPTATLKAIVLSSDTPIPTVTQNPSMMFQQDFESGIPAA